MVQSGGVQPHLNRQAGSLPSKNIILIAKCNKHILTACQPHYALIPNETELTMLKAILVVLIVSCSACNASAEVQKPNKKILFVCTGNYYRSRFAESYFNWKAGNSALPWQAVSRGLRVETGRKGISELAHQELTIMGVPDSQTVSDPQQLTRQDLLTSDYVVILDEEEHRPMMERQFPGMALNNLHYWHIHDHPYMQAHEACSTMAVKIDSLLTKLQK
jgi:protein-tyrosine phosphatase